MANPEWNTIGRPANDSAGRMVSVHGATSKSVYSSMPSGVCLTSQKQQAAMPPAIITAVKYEMCITYRITVFSTMP